MGYFVRLASIIGAAALFAGCGGSPFIGPTPFARTTAQLRPSGVEYLYVSTLSSTIYEFSYPSGSAIATITVAGASGAACADTNGNVAVTAEGDSQSGIIYEFASGASSPTQTLTETGYAGDCSYDPSTGNLAVANFTGSVAIFSNGGGTPTMYTTPSYFAAVTSCAYDDAGNLFVGGAGEAGSGLPFVLAELPKGSSLFIRITLDQQIANGAGYGMQWNNGDLAVTYLPERGNGPTTIYRVSISGSAGTVKGSTKLKTHNRNSRISAPYTWIIDGKVLAPSWRSGVELWAYPKGGKRKAAIPGQRASGEAVSSST